jgi:hypothetical protein
MSEQSRLLVLRKQLSRFISVLFDINYRILHVRHDYMHPFVVKRKIGGCCLKTVTAPGECDHKLTEVKLTLPLSEKKLVLRSFSDFLRAQAAVFQMH